MKNVLKALMTVALIAISSFTSYSQDYKTAIGLRLGGLSSGITVKGFVNSNAAIEGIASFAHHSFIMTGLYEVHRDIPSATGLKWFYGGGAHLGFFRYGGYYYVYKYKGDHIYVAEEGGSRVVPGIDFILGLDYKFTNAPINIGLDIKPFIDFIDGTNGFFDGALSFRFAF